MASQEWGRCSLLLLQLVGVGHGIAGVGAVLFATSAVGGAGVAPGVGDGVASGMVAVCHTGLLETGSETAAPSFQVSADPFRRVQNVKS